jgi:hypothetical protein
VSLATRLIARPFAHGSTNLSPTVKARKLLAPDSGFFSSVSVIYSPFVVLIKTFPDVFGT